MNFIKQFLRTHTYYELHQNMIKMYTNKVGDLDNRVQEIKETAIRNFSSIEALFAFKDAGLIDEFGNF